MVGADVFQADKTEVIIRGSQSAVPMLLAGGRFALAVHQAIEDQMADDAGTFLRSFLEGLGVGSAIVHADDGLRGELSFEGLDLVSARDRIIREAFITTFVLR